MIPVINKYINNVQVQLTNTGALDRTGENLPCSGQFRYDPMFPCAHRSPQPAQTDAAERDGKGRPV